MSNVDDNRSVLTELKTDKGNVLVSLTLTKAEVILNVVSSVFGKSDNSVARWIRDGYLTFVDKEKALNYLHSSAPIAEVSSSQELDYIANIVENFESPNLEGVGDDKIIDGEQSDDVRFRRELNEVNDKFNEELEGQIKGELPEGHVYSLGRPSATLRSAGLPDLPIELASSRLEGKSKQPNHPFNLEEVFDLPKHIHNPLAVFGSATRLNSYIVMTELKHKDKAFVVAIEANRKQGRIEVNSIRSIHYRSRDVHFANWIVDGLLEYVDKKRMPEWLSKRQYHSADVRNQFRLATKVVENFENPKLKADGSGEKIDGEQSEGVRFRRGVPKRRAGEGVSAFAGRVVEYNRESGTWFSDDVEVPRKPRYEGGSIVAYAQEVEDWHNDFDVRFRMGGNVGSMPEEPKLNSGMSVADMANATNEYHKRVRGNNERLEKEMNGLLTHRGKLKQAFVDRALSLETFNKAMREIGVEISGGEEAYSNLLRSAGMANTDLDRANAEVLNPLRNELSRHTDALKTTDVFDELRLVFRDKETGEVLDGSDKVVDRFRIEGLYLQALDIIEAEELGLVERGRSGFSDAERVV